MSDKKIIVAALILAALLAGGGWYYSKHQVPSAAILPTGTASPETVASEPGIIIGNPDAPVVMEEYTNFLCPACGNFASGTLERIKEEYIKTGKVKLIVYIYPPQELSKAALCAQEQNKFMEYHNYLFTHQGQISSEKDLKDLAANAGLDTQKFDACFDALNKYQDKIQKWYDEGEARGVDATPTFFINGQKFIGAQPFEDFQKIIEGKLNQAK
ncbi:MAG: DSBA oxidoreductase [Parcubacteria group bacterium LiPW_39]|nr:MAG: DSBA oxidoreductase [Parcubacteria group bacterium LiPW_39]